MLASVAPLFAASLTLAAAAPPAGAAEIASVELKLTEGSALRVRGHALRSGVAEERAAVEAVLDRHGATGLTRLFTREETALARDEQRLEARSGRRLEDLALHATVTVPAVEAAALVVALERVGAVESAAVESRPTPLPATPDLTADQGYFGAAPVGLGSAAVRAIAGAQGEHVTVADVEYSWNRQHEDASQLAGAGALIANGTPSDPWDTTDHGTAATAIIAGDPNGYGVTGLAPRARMRVVNAANLERGWDVANAIELARTRLAPGDVIVLEQQAVGPDGRYVPVEWLPSVYDAVAWATAAGIVVVEAAGNGDADLDAPLYEGAFTDGRADSGAIVVGAGGVPGCGTPRTRLGFSSYGTRVDLQGWGQCVTSAGYGDHGGAERNAWYTRSFSGTSSATAVVAAAAAAYSSAVEARRGSPPTPAEVRRALVESGTPQDTTSAGALPGHIGPLPNLVAALRPLVDGGPGASSGNRVANASFETDTSGWASWQGTLTRTKLAGAPRGGSVARVARATGASYSLSDDAGPARPTVTATEPGQTYSAAAWIRAAGGAAAGKPIRIVLREKTPSGATVAETIAVGTLGTGFKPLAVAARATAAGNSLGVRVEQLGAAAGDAFYADGVAVAEGNRIRNPSFEGDVAGWGAWRATMTRAALAGAPHGAAVARVSRSSGTSFSLDDAFAGAQPTISATTAGVTYVAGAHVRAAASASAGKPLRLVLRERTPAGATVRETVSSVTLTSTFQRVAVAAEAAAPGNRLGLRLEHTGAVAGSVFEADQVTLGAA